MGFASGLIGAGSSIFSGIMGQHGGDKAANAITGAMNQGNDLWKQQNANNHSINDPFIDLGHGAAGTLGYLLGTGKDDPNLAGGTGGSYGSLMHTFGANDFQTDPGYQFRLQQGQKALDRSAAAKGTVFSGGTMKANDMYNQDFASNEYGNAFNRYMQDRASKYGMLAGTTQLGQNSANTQTNANDQYAGNVADNLLRGTGMANDYRLSGTAALTNGITGGLNQLQQMLMMRNLGGASQAAPTSKAPY